MPKTKKPDQSQNGFPEWAQQELIELFDDLALHILLYVRAHPDCPMSDLEDE